MLIFLMSWIGPGEGVSWSQPPISMAGTSVSELHHAGVSNSCGHHSTYSRSGVNWSGESFAETRTN